MDSYRDKDGTEHQIEITLRTRRAFRDLLSVDLLAVGKDPTALREFLGKLATDDEYLLQVIAIAEHTTVEALESAYDATTLEAAGDAFMEALTDFFPDSSPMKKPLRKLLDRLRSNQAQLGAQAEQTLIDSVDDLDLSMVTSGSMIPTNGSSESPPAADTSTDHGNSSLSENCSGVTAESPINNS